MKKRQFTNLLLAAGFLLGIQNGYVALWRDGQTEPAEIFPYRVEHLPPADQQALEKGIHLEDQGELARLLEDYLS